MAGLAFRRSQEAADQPSCRWVRALIDGDRLRRRSDPPKTHFRWARVAAALAIAGAVGACGKQDQATASTPEPVVAAADAQDAAAKVAPDAAPPPLSPFAAALHGRYELLAAEARARGDYAGLAHFSKRALLTERGAPPLPRAPDELASAGLVSPEAAAAARRFAAQVGETSLAQPDLAAETQAALDCWLWESAPGGDDAVASVCAARARAALGVLAGAEQHALGAEVSRIVEAAKPRQGEFVVFFALDSAELTDEARENVLAAAAEIQMRSVRVVRLYGHADATGGVGYNRLLSARRAEAVADALVTLVGPHLEVSIHPHGEGAPRIRTADGVASALNRRVEIALGPAGGQAAAPEPATAGEQALVEMAVGAATL